MHIFMSIINHGERNFFYKNIILCQITGEEAPSTFCPHQSVESVVSVGGLFWSVIVGQPLRLKASEMDIIELFPTPLWWLDSSPKIMPVSTNWTIWSIHGNCLLGQYATQSGCHWNKNKASSKNSRIVGHENLYCNHSLPWNLFPLQTLSCLI